MLRNYEFTVIFRSDLGDENLTAALQSYEGIITANDGGTIVKKDEWGTKRFSYPIKKHFRGYYVCYVISTTPKVIKDIEQHIRYDSKVLRYILIAIKGDIPAVEVKTTTSEDSSVSKAPAAPATSEANAPEANASDTSDSLPDADAPEQEQDK